jgi:hypothetical protein
MATNLSINELRHRLGSPEGVSAEPFAVLKSIAALVNATESQDLGRDMLLRALEWRTEFGDLGDILDSMARATGLFPYANPQALSGRELLAYEYHRPENLGDIVFHREQAQIYHRLLAGDSVILSAPTSFGKSRIIDAMVATGRYKNIVVVVPTLALIDETRRRLAAFASHYKLITHLSQLPSQRNIFILTAERVVAYESFPRIDFFVIDEFYKIGALEEDESRTVALNEAFYRLLKDRGQFYLLGPSIQHIPAGLEDAYRCFFFPTRYATVAVDTVRAPGTGKDMQRLLGVLQSLSEPTLIYCSSPDRVNEVARAMLETGLGIDAPSLHDASTWIGKHFHPEWVLAAGLTRGIGIHHGRLPRSLSQFVVRAFNEERIRFLICTSTLIEGVNTKAKNVVIWDNRIANRALDFFTFNNIRGRSGRMFQHFVGRVFLFDDPPPEELPFVDFPLFTQDTGTPESLLIQLDPADLSERSKERIKRFTDQPVLSIELLRMNHSVDPEAQIKLARYIEANAASVWPKLAWRGFPENYNQLKFACELIWSHLVDSRRRHGVRSGSQLTLKTWQLYHTVNTAKRVLAELQPGQWAAKTPDEAVERVLQFDRSWAGFELPRLLTALSSIQREVLSRMALPFGDYSAFAAQAESLFRAPVVAALEEYGIPIQVAEKLQAFLRTKDNLDVALESLKALDTGRIRLLPFEAELVQDAQSAL